MVEWVRWFLSELPLIALTAICTHLVVSSGQTLFHYGFGHHRVGGIFYRNHIGFHHTFYARAISRPLSIVATTETTRITFSSP
jgi:hypothetical protein